MFYAMRGEIKKKDIIMVSYLRNHMIYKYSARNYMINMFTDLTKCVLQHQKVNKKLN